MSEHAGKSAEKGRADRREPRVTERRRVRTVGAHESIRALQQAAGNRAVTNLLASSSGRPLDVATRKEMESRFGANFADVRIHTGLDAAAKAVSAGARAYTQGKNIVFSEDFYAPQTRDGKRLLAHELAHLVQQSRSDQGLGSPARAEYEARAVGAKVSAGGSATVGASAGGSAQLDPMTEDERLARMGASPELAASLERVVPARTAERAAPPTPSKPVLASVAPSAAALGGTIFGPTPTGPGGPGPSGFDFDPRPYPPIPGDQFGSKMAETARLAKLTKDASTAGRATEAAAVATSGQGAGALATGGALALGFGVGFFGTLGTAYALQRSAELREQPDPDQTFAPGQSSPPGGAPPQTQSAGAVGAEEIQAPSPAPLAPAIDPGGHPVSLPPSQDQAPAIDPSPTPAAQLPGQSSEALQAGVGRRPTLRKSTILEAWRRAARAGAVRDPHSGEVLEPPYYDQNGKLVYDWHMGHIAGHEWWRLNQMHKKGLLPWKRVVDIYNDPTHYNPESQEENVRHEHESDEDWSMRGRVIRRDAPTRGKPIRRKRK